MMKSCCPSRFNGFLLLAIGAFALVATLGASAFHSPGEQDGEKGRSVGGYMKEIKKALGALEAAAGSAETKAGALAAVRDLQAAAMGAKNADPRSANRIEDAAEKEKFLLEYRKIQVEFLKVCLDLEVAVLEGNADQTKALMAKLEELEDTGHSKFKKGRR